MPEFLPGNRGFDTYLGIPVRWAGLEYKPLHRLFVTTSLAHKGLVNCALLDAWSEGVALYLHADVFSNRCGVGLAPPSSPGRPVVGPPHLRPDVTRWSV